MKNHEVKMIHEDLSSAPVFVLENPEYSFRMYRSGCEKEWLHIHEVSDQYNAFTPFVFADQFGGDTDRLAHCQFYLLDPVGQPIGTCTAWSKNGTNYSGVVHWLAILPQHQGKGLSKPLLSAVCRKLLIEGHAKASLSTSTARIAAINLYLQFGFRPLIQSEDDEISWNHFEQQAGLKLPV